MIININGLENIVSIVFPIAAIIAILIALCIIVRWTRNDIAAKRRIASCLEQEAIIHKAELVYQKHAPYDDKHWNNYYAFLRDMDDEVLITEIDVFEALCKDKLDAVKYSKKYGCYE